MLNVERIIKRWEPRCPVCGEVDEDGEVEFREFTAAIIRALADEIRAHHDSVAELILRDWADKIEDKTNEQAD